jgi:cytochrome c oxidase assembly factor CtaG
MAGALARRRAWRVATHPAVALPLWLADYFAWHVPAVYDYALTHQQWLIHAEHACYFGSGLLVWWPLVHDVPRRLPSGARAAYAFAAFVLAAPLGLLLALLPRPVYHYYVEARPRVWGLSPLADQEIAGVTMAGEQAIVLFVVFLYWFRRFLAEEG